jgi:hypothetical protein
MAGNPEGIPALSYSFCRRLARPAVRLAGEDARLSTKARNGRRRFLTDL